MDLFFPAFPRRSPLRNKFCILGSFWVAGLVVGICIFGSLTEFDCGFLRQTIVSPVSVIGVFTAVLLPVISTIFAAFTSSFWLLYPIAFLTAFSHSFWGISILSTCGSGGWLLLFLFFFSSIISIPVLWVCWIELLRRGKDLSIGFLCFIMSISALSGAIDFWMVSPFLRDVLLS